MELPEALRDAIEAQLVDVKPADLRDAAAHLSARYRAIGRDGRVDIGDAAAVQAYLATRMPATFASIRRGLAETADRLPEFEPESLLDLGAGPGTVLWAAAECWESIETARLMEASGAFRETGATLAAPLAGPQVDWIAADVTHGLDDVAPADLVVLGYMLNEVAEHARERLVERAWALTRGVFVLVEPGTPAGWERMLAVRGQLIAAGAEIVAPCPHAQDCPLVAPDWCHFAERVARSRRHLHAKAADVPWEDEKFIYLAAAREAPERPRARVIAPRRPGSGKVQLKLCQADGEAGERLVTKREGEAFRTARRVDWGDAFVDPAS